MEENTGEVGEGFLMKEREEIQERRRMNAAETTRPRRMPVCLSSHECVMPARGKNNAASRRARHTAVNCWEPPKIK